MFVNKHLAYLKFAHLKKWGVIMCNPCDTIFYKKTNVLQYFHICISVPLKFISFLFIVQNLWQWWLIAAGPTWIGCQYQYINTYPLIHFQSVFNFLNFVFSNKCIAITLFTFRNLRYGHQNVDRAPYYH